MIVSMVGGLGKHQKRATSSYRLISDCDMLYTEVFCLDQLPSAWKPVILVFQALFLELTPLIYGNCLAPVCTLAMLCNLGCVLDRGWAGNWLALLVLSCLAVLVRRYMRRVQWPTASLADDVRGVLYLSEVVEGHASEQRHCAQEASAQTLLHSIEYQNSYASSVCSLSHLVLGFLGDKT